MKKLIFISLIFSLIAAFFPVNAVIQETLITVYVKTPGNYPVEGINTNVTQSESNYDSSLTTNEQGKAEFKIPENIEGTFSVSISLDSSSYELVSGETNPKSLELQEGESETAYFGVKETATPEEPEETKNISIPAGFYENGSDTSRFEDVTVEELESFPNFTIHKPDYAKIVYDKALNLSSTTSINKLKTLDQYVFMEYPGEVSVASDLFPELNNSATVTLEGLNFVQLSQGYKPHIMKDNADAGESISNVALTNGNKISFEVDGFSSYSVRPTFEFDENEIETTETAYTLTGKIDDLDSEISVYLNDESQDMEIEIDDDGEFEIQIELKEKENVVQVLAVGVSEQTYSEVVKITNPNLEEIEEEVDDGMSINMTIVLGTLIMAMIIGGGIGYYYYKKRQNKADKKDTSVKYDDRLLTPEEKKNLAKEQKEKIAKHDNNAKKEDQPKEEENQIPKL
ncbi:hypothetical protein GF389_04980 [Candidatus Dojkabacteria bacterium]|nr:hypothetical protein [Candidatus Dojkabacteria bacterium]